MIFSNVLLFYYLKDTFDATPCPVLEFRIVNEVSKAMFLVHVMRFRLV